MKPVDLPGASARMNCARSESLRAASIELRIVSEALRADTHELLATSAEIRRRSEAVIGACAHRQRAESTASPQAVHSLSTGKLS